jgi:outer membrane protein
MFGAHRIKLVLAAACLAAAALPVSAQITPASTNSIPAWDNHPLSLADAINLALQQNGAILRGKSDLEAQYGVVVQTRAVAIPKVTANGDYQNTSEVESLPFPGFSPQHESWAANIQITQSIYDGGRLTSGLRSARLIKDQAVLQYESVVADAVLAVRVAYYDVLSAAQQVVVNQASVELLTKQWDDQTNRFDAGTVPRFNVLQAEVALANERPVLIQARNAYRIAQNNLVNTLGYHVPGGAFDDLALRLTDHLDDEAYSLDLPLAVAKALQDRTELAALRKAELLSEENVINARAGYKPTVQLVAGYGGRNSTFFNDLGFDVSGYTAGAQVSWNIFDGLLTQGKVQQARALQTGARVDVDNETRTIELEVRTDHSNFIEARETLESQKKVQELAEEALRLAIARADAGTGTQLDVLNSQTSLTQARSTQVQALHDYDVARARLQRAIGADTFAPDGGSQPKPK